MSCGSQTQEPLKFPRKVFNAPRLLISKPPCYNEMNESIKERSVVRAMWLEKLVVKNFRSFEKLSVSFEQDCTVLIGINGSGKTSVLDAAALALGGFLAGLDGVETNSLHLEDVRYAMYEQGSSVARERQYPLVVEGHINLQSGHELIWSRELNSDRDRTTSRNAKSIMEYAVGLQKQIRDGRLDVVLPLIAYYGTGHLWAQKQTRAAKAAKRRLGLNSRIRGYKDCLDAASNVQLMLEWFEKMTYLQLQEGKTIPELHAVEKAMADCYSRMDDRALAVQVRYNVKYEELEILIRKTDGTSEYLPLHQLSDGIRTILTMVADIAYRMAILNPQMLAACVKDTPGIVLIDEIDMHLHPAWQKNIIRDLRYTFPHVQFILTTHAPSVLANVHRENIRILCGNQVTVPDVKGYGRNVDAIVYELMGTKVRPKDVTQLIADFYDDIDGGRMSEAQKKLQQLREQLGDNDQNVLDAQMSYDLESL